MFPVSGYYIHAVFTGPTGQSAMVFCKVDSGATDSVISAETAQRIGFQPTGVEDTARAGGSSHFYSGPVTISVGNAPAVQVQVLQANVDLLGMDVISHYNLLTPAPGIVTM